MPSVSIDLLFLDFSLFCFVLRQGLALLPTLMCNGTNMAHYHLNLLGSSNPLASASQIAGTTGMCHHVQVLFKFFVEKRSCHVAQAVLDLWAQPILLQLPFKVLGLQVWATGPGWNHTVWSLRLPPFFVCLEMASCCVTQPGVRWRNHNSLQPQTPELKWCCYLSSQPP